MILVRRKEDGVYEVVSGEMRLSTQIKLRGSAEVMDISSRKTLTVHEVGGKLVALNETSQKTVENAAAAAIDSVRGRKP
ncbi:hypothetical protein [Ralstonia pseudosolanacearum]|uniref:hypothetical protein n=1 Tax=Ralstonia pseudosolanacearum TaxID=1310165 RepID=UPI003CF2A940